MSCNNIYLAKKEVNGEQVQKKTWRLYTRLLFFIAQMRAVSKSWLVWRCVLSLVSFPVPSEEKHKIQKYRF